MPLTKSAAPSTTTPHAPARCSAWLRVRRDLWCSRIAPGMTKHMVVPVAAPSRDATFSTLDMKGASSTAAPSKAHVAGMK